MDGVGRRARRVRYGFGSLVPDLQIASAPGVVAKLTAGEFDQVIEIVGRWPDQFPPGTLGALKSRVRYPPAGQQPIASRPIRRADRALSHRAAKSAAARQSVRHRA